MTPTVHATPATLASRLKEFASRVAPPAYTTQSTQYAQIVPPVPVLDAKPDEREDNTAYTLYDEWSESWMPGPTEVGLPQRSRLGQSPMIDEPDPTEALDLIGDFVGIHPVTP